MVCPGSHGPRRSLDENRARNRPGGHMTLIARVLSLVFFLSLTTGSVVAWAAPPPGNHGPSGDHGDGLAKGHDDDHGSQDNGKGKDGDHGGGNDHGGGD